MVEADHPYVAHYDEPDEPDRDRDRRDAEALAQAERDSARLMDFARGRVLRALAGVFLACVSIAGGAVAVMAVVAALAAGSGPVNLVTDIESSGVATTTVTSGQLLTIAGVLVALEVLLIWAAMLLFSRRLQPTQWIIVGVLAATAAVALFLRAGSSSIGTTEWPYLAAFPLIVVAAVLELLRSRRLRSRWGAGAGK